MDNQARWSPALVEAADHKLFPIYREKDQAGLRIIDRTGGEIYRARFPERVFPDFASIPSLVVNTLLFIEDRYVLDRANPERNPAIEWKRFALAAAGQVAELVVSDADAGGASTLATQIEKFRHSPGGRTGGALDKMRQMVTASLRAYYDGPNTLKRREEIVTTYLNSTPLASMPGYGEIIGLPDALRIWFGTDLAEATEVLNKTPRTAAELSRQGEIYRQVLAFLVSGRRPSYYLLDDRAALGVLIDNHLYALANAGVISPSLRDAALNADLHFRSRAAGDHGRGVLCSAQIDRGGAQPAGRPVAPSRSVRARPARPDRRDLDRSPIRRRASPMSWSGCRIRLSCAARACTATVCSTAPIRRRSPGASCCTSAATVTATICACTRTASTGRSTSTRVRNCSSARRPSCARSPPISQIIAKLHRQLADVPARDLSRLAASADDALSGWAASYLARASDRSLQPMLEAALQRRYSAAPQEFFTGGGSHVFENFARWEDHTNPTVLEAFEQSINLAFIRLLRDVLNYYNAEERDRG